MPSHPFPLFMLSHAKHPYTSLLRRTKTTTTNQRKEQREETKRRVLEKLHPLPPFKRNILQALVLSRQIQLFKYIMWKNNPILYVYLPNMHTYTKKNDNKVYIYSYFLSSLSKIHVILLHDFFLVIKAQRLKCNQWKTERTLKQIILK